MALGPSHQSGRTLGLNCALQKRIITSWVLRSGLTDANLSSLQSENDPNTANA